ncbi:MULTISPECIES: GntP family permease [Oceanobacillus]|uniref:Permease n=1 Tax=Oceanobacillus kimchii TaxID=746691 RepID=A0ABQ5TQF4_9BACI|nr:MULTISPECIES: GntP family permease [Oceanobacillus]MBT2600341.1 GntP family permease [Oceanobacillus sp. ISL-74]MBT2650499.1 GntP family permease [Oceanobacillus sp. ISL-73]OEH54955.1 citrate transporter [Oceanobacillus sp. E9]GLO67390.1 permease [Oceanobacillus kimchii]
MEFLGMIGLLVSLIVLIYLTMKGVNIIIGAIISSVIVALTGGLRLDIALMDNYMTGFTGYFASWFFVFLLGAIFGKIMQETKSADSIAQWIKKLLGPKRAVFAVVAAAAIMTYGGVSLFVVGFAVYPIAVSLFRSANLPHRFIPAALVFGSISFTMTAPGSPEIQNIIPTEFFGTTPTAGGWIGVVCALLIMTLGGLWLGSMVKKATAKGETFSLPNGGREESAASMEANLAQQESDPKKEDLPNIIISSIPLVLVIVLLNVLGQFMNPTIALLIALLVGITVACLTMLRFLTEFWNSLATGAQNALVALANTCAVVGFGSVAAQVSAFDSLITGLVNLPGPPLIGLAIGVTVICAITGSASGGLGIALPILAPIYLAQGLDPGSMHRISALASGGLDSLPHNGYVVTTVRAICGESHGRAYKPILMVSVILPTIVLALAVILYTIF